MQEQGPVGIAAWEALSSFIRRNQRKVSNQIVHDGARPEQQTIEARWKEAEEQAHVLNVPRGSVRKNEASEKAARAITQKVTSKIYPDILSYHLSAHLFRHSHEAVWTSDVRALAMDDRPYRSQNELEAHCNSLPQLLSVLAHQVTTEHLAEVCETVAKADNHNAFGINSGTNEQEREEYMGFAVFPAASYFNHSCRPNLIKSRRGRAWTFRTNCDIADGVELCITYLGGAEEELDVWQRRARLRETWGFDCQCQKCLEDLKE
jgi:SET and MYND domain-containing protein